MSFTQCRDCCTLQLSNIVNNLELKTRKSISYKSCLGVIHSTIVPPGVRKGKVGIPCALAIQKECFFPPAPSPSPAPDHATFPQFHASDPLKSATLTAHTAINGKVYSILYEYCTHNHSYVYIIATEHSNHRPTNYDHISRIPRPSPLSWLNFRRSFFLI